MAADWRAVILAAWTATLLLSKLPLVIIADISGSMERYTRLLLPFIFGLAQSRSQPVGAFIFSTSLTRITRQLHIRDIDRAMSGAADIARDWAVEYIIGRSQFGRNPEDSRSTKRV